MRETQWTVGGLRKPATLAGGEDRTAGGAVKAGGEAAVEAPPPRWEVRAEEDRAADLKPRGPQPIVGAQRLESGEQELHPQLGARALGRFAGEQELRFEERAGVAELGPQRLADPAALELQRRVAAPGAAFVVEELSQAAPLAVQALGLALQPALQARLAAARHRQQIDADVESLSLIGAKRGHRRGEGLQGIGDELEASQRLDA